MNKIAIIDFGGQYAHLIARRIRNLGVYSEILHNDFNIEDLKDYQGIILSGGPSSVYAKGAPACDEKIFELGIPVLGICYGIQLMAQKLGGSVENCEVREDGKRDLTITKGLGIFSSFNTKDKPQELVVWITHGDQVESIPDGFETVASTETCKHAAIINEEKKLIGVQFHPEVTHTQLGNEMLKNFIKFCGIKPDWKVNESLDQRIENLKDKIGEKNVFLLISGGVDSTVTYALLSRAIEIERIYALYVDTGFMRHNETNNVSEALEKAGLKINVYDAEDRFLDALKDIYDPEEKRKIIGDMFLEIQREVVKDLKLDPEHWLLAQGTIYPDTIESGGTNNADTIKTHHNRVPEIEKLIEEGKVIEPLSDLYKDEVRKIGRELGLPDSFIERHPFPGPGLAIRILCANNFDNEVDLEDLEKEITNNELKDSPLAIKILPLKSVGVQGDCRTYKNPLVVSGEASYKELKDFTNTITNTYKDVNRVVYRLNTKDLSDVVLLPRYVTKKRADSLRKVDHFVNKQLSGFMKSAKVWQMPIVLIPVSFTGDERESIVLRPISSTEAMTADAAEIPFEVLFDIAEKIRENFDISEVFYDLTSKPPGTIEWE